MRDRTPKGPVATPDVRRKAMALLARREHSRVELEGKLASRGMPADRITDVLNDLEREGSLSDRRYAEAFVRQRFEKGYGPVRIAQELRQRGVGADSVTAVLAQVGIVEGLDPWTRGAIRVRAKRFGLAAPDDPRERARQERYLRYRGFTGEQVRAAMAANTGSV